MDERELADPDSVVADDDNGTVGQIRREVIEVAQDQFGMLISGQQIAGTKQDDRRAGALRHRQQCPEIGVAGNDDPALTFSEQQQLDVFGSLEPEFEGMNSIVPTIAEQ